jgi:hypothetical protein
MTDTKSKRPEWPDARAMSTSEILAELARLTVELAKRADPDIGHPDTPI